MKTRKDSDNQKKETHESNALKSIAYPPSSFPAKPNHGWSPVSFVNDFPKPALGSQAGKPLLPVPVSSHTSLASPCCVDARNKSKEEGNPRRASRHPSLCPAEPERWEQLLLDLPYTEIPMGQSKHQRLAL